MSLAQVRQVDVPQYCVDEVHEHLHRVGRAGHEGFGLWAGTQDGARFTVTRALIPAQRHIRTEDGICVIVGPDELHRINVWLYREKLALIAQIHSHPGRAYHSSTDDAYAVATAVGCLSLVVPDFATRPFEMRTTATYRLDPKAQWREVTQNDAARLIQIGG